MEQFRKILTAYLQGTLSPSKTQQALGALAAADPSKSQAYIQQLNHLYKNRRLPPQLYSMFRNAVLKPEEIEGEDMDPLHALDAAAADVGPAATPPAASGEDDKGGDDGDEVNEDDEDDEDVGKTVFRVPASNAEPDEDANETRFRPQATGRSQSAHSQVTDLSGPDLSTGGAAGTGTGSSWGRPSAWTGAEGEGDSGPVDVGTIIKHRFVLEQLIGKGGMGMVYKARDLRKEEAQDRQPYVALKVLNEEFKKHPESLKALQREARKAQELAHPNIVNVHDFDRDGGTVFMTMELLEGTPLDRLIRENKGTGIPWNEALPLIKGMSLALDYAHRKRIVHSDFKPGNCFLTEDGSVKVFDFGIARAAKHKGDLKGEETKFDAGTLGALTPAYATCEMIDGAEPDPRDDIYALACTAYELLAGRHPFDKVSAADARDKGLQPNPVKDLSRSRFKALLRGLDLARANRTKSAFQFLEDLNPRSSNKWFKVGIGTAAVIALVIAGLVFVPNYLYKKKLDAISAGLRDGEFGDVSGAIGQFELIKADDRQLLLNRFDDNIISKFDSRIGEAFNRELDLYDYPTARELLDQLALLYPDSSRVNSIDEQVERDRKELQSQMSGAYDGFLEARQLLPADGDDIYDLREIVEQIDPSDQLLSDARLPQALAVEARAAAAGQDFDTAEQYLSAGLSLAPDDADLINVRDEVETARIRIERAEEIAGLEARLQPLTQRRAALADFDDAQRDFVQLADLQPNNEVLLAAQRNVERLLGTVITADVDKRLWEDATARLAAYEGIVTPGFASEQNATIDSQRAAHKDVLAAISARIDAAIAAGNLDQSRGASAMNLFRQLELAGADAQTIATARDRIATGYLDASRAARAKNEWEKARVLVAGAEALAPSDAVVAAVGDELAKIGNQETLAEQELIDQEIQGLKSRFDERLAQAAFEKADIVAAARSLSDLQERFGTANGVADFVTQGRSRITDRVATQSMTLAQEGRWQDATALIASGETALGRSDSLQSTRTRIGEMQREQASEQLQAQIRRGEQTLAGLLQTPDLDDAWQAEFERQLASLEGLEAGNAFAVEARERAAGLYLRNAQSLREESRWVVAQQQLANAQALAPTLPAVINEARAFEAGRDEYERQLAQARRQAEIDAKRQLFTRELDADRLDRAEQTFAELGRLLPAGDAFLTQQGPGVLVDGRLRVAADNARLDRYSTALEQLQLALRHAPGDPRIAAARSQYEDQRDAYNTVRTGNAASVGALSSVMVRLEGTMDDFAAFRGRLERVLKRRIEERATANRPDADALFAAASSSFPTLSVDWPRAAQTTVAASLPAEPPPEEQVVLVSPPVATPPVQRPRGAGRACRASSAGNGKQRTCYDGLPGGQRAPILVVVPGVGGGAPFAVSRTEISIKDYDLYCAQSGDCSPFGGNAKLPATNLSASAMESYAGWLSAQTGQSYSLPNLAQWQHAARAGGARLNPNINCVRNVGGRQADGFSLADVSTGGTDRANAWGLRQVVGNAEEVVVSGGAYVGAGGAYSDRVNDCTPDFTRPFGGATERSGFRVVRNVD